MVPLTSFLSIFGWQKRKGKSPWNPQNATERKTEQSFALPFSNSPSYQPLRLYLPHSLSPTRCISEALQDDMTWVTDGTRLCDLKDAWIDGWVTHTCSCHWVDGYMWWWRAKSWIKCKKKGCKRKRKVIYFLAHLLTSGCGPATEPGQVKVTNSWHLLWTTKLQTRGKHRAKYLYYRSSHTENIIWEDLIPWKETITLDLFYLSLPWHWNPCLPMPLSEKRTLIKTQTQSSILLFKVKYVASQTVCQPGLSCQDRDRGNAVELFHSVLRPTDMQAQVENKVFLIKKTKFDKQVIMFEV